MTAITMPKAVWRDSEELTMFKDSVRGFFTKEAPPEVCAKWRENGIVDRDMWTKAGQAGLLCVSMPEEFGGGGGDFRHEAVIMDVMGTMGIDGFGLPLHNAIIAPYLKHYGSQEQKQKWLPKMASGELVGAIAMTEPGAGSDLQGIKTTALQQPIVERAGFSLYQCVSTARSPLSSALTSGSPNFLKIWLLVDR